MGSWGIWHFAAFIAVAVAAGGRSRRQAAATTSGYGGWLIVLSAFLLFWAAQELAEFYRVKTQIEILIPSALENPVYHRYIAYAKALAWLQAIALAIMALWPKISRAAWTPRFLMAMLWLAGPIPAAIELALGEIYFGEYLVEHDYSALAATILFATVWSWYLLVSTRVKNTY